MFRTILFFLLIVIHVDCARRSVENIRTASPDTSRISTSGSSTSSSSRLTSTTGVSTSSLPPITPSSSSPRSSSTTPSPTPSTSTARTPSTSTARTPSGSVTSTARTPSVSTASTTSSFIFCFVCGDAGRQTCPKPFSTVGHNLTVTYVPRSRFCLRKTLKDSSSQIIRREATLSECNAAGCYKDSSSTEFCCCNDRDGCNTGVLSNKSTLALILSTLALLKFFYQNNAVF